MAKLLSAILLISVAGCTAQSRIDVVEKTSASPSFGWAFPAAGDPNRQTVRHYGPHAQLREQGHLHSYWACLQGEVFLTWNANAVETLDEDMVEIKSACEDTFYLDFDYRVEGERVGGQLHINRFHPYRAYWSMPLELTEGEAIRRTLHAPGGGSMTMVLSYATPAILSSADD